MQRPVLALPDALRLVELEGWPADGWHWEDQPPEIELGAASPPLRYIDPVAVAMLAAWAEHQRRGGVDLVIAPSLKCPEAWRSGLLPCLAGRAVPAKPRDEQSRFPPVRLASEHAFIHDDFYTRLGGLGLSGDAEDLTRFCIEDIARNVFHHAATRGGAHIAATHDRRSGRVRVGVADCGKGIAQDIRDNLGQDLNDIQAVRIAIEPRVSGTSQPNINLGVGLYNVRRLVLAADGALSIRTGRVVATASTRSPDSFVPEIAEQVTEPALARGCSLTIDFSETRTATQAFC